MAGGPTPEHRIAAAVLPLLDLPVWVGHAGAQDAVDEALLAIVEATLGPPLEAEPLPTALIAPDGRADRGAIAATAAALGRAARQLDEAGASGPAAAARELQAALQEYGDALLEIPRAPARGVTRLGQIRAAKQLVAGCRAAQAYVSTSIPTSVEP